MLSLIRLFILLKVCIIAMLFTASLLRAAEEESHNIPETPEEYLKENGLKSHYDIDSNRVVLYYDPQGKLLAHPESYETPLTDFDEDDLFEVHIVHALTEDEEENRYRIGFKPLSDSDRRSWTDLLSFVPPALSIAGLKIPTEKLMAYARRGKNDGEPYWTETVEIQGPFDAGTYALEIYNVDALEETSTKLEMNQIRINPLLHFGLQFGLIASFLTDPDEYKIARLQGTSYNTIVSSSGLVRGIPTINVVIYDWFLNRGRRDRNKDFGGIFPTVGIGLQKPQENFFAGVIWEASRIVSINAGAHFGKAARLSEEFELGEDVLWEDSTLINRTDNTIKFSKEWQVNGYVGATIDIGFLLDFLLR